MCPHTMYFLSVLILFVGRQEERLICEKKFCINRLSISSSNFRKMCQWSMKTSVYVMMYVCCVCWSNRPMYPTQRGCQLREDIIALVRFWHGMHSDKKYLRTSDMGGQLQFFIITCCSDSNWTFRSKLVFFSLSSRRYYRLCSFLPICHFILKCFTFVFYVTILGLLCHCSLVSLKFING